MCDRGGLRRARKRVKAIASRGKGVGGDVGIQKAGTIILQVLDLRVIRALQIIKVDERDGWCAGHSGEGKGERRHFMRTANVAVTAERRPWTLGGGAELLL